MSDVRPAEHGPLALLGGEGQRPGVVAGELVGEGVTEVLVLPTAAAYEHPEVAVERARVRFAELGVSVVGCPVLRRGDAEDERLAARVRAARFCYLSDGSPLHLRSVLKDSLVLHALVSAWRDGAALLGSGAGAMVLSDPMLDPRGGAFTVGLGFIRNVAVSPGYNGELTAQLRRTLSLAPSGCPVVALAPGTAAVRESDGSWRLSGPGPAEVFLEGLPAGLDALAGKPVS